MTELYAECIICWNEKQCLKPCACTARICMVCLLRSCAEDFEDNLKCPQCRANISKEEYGVPKVDPGFTQLVTTALIQSSMFRIERPRPFVHDIAFNIVNPFEGIEPRSPSTPPAQRADLSGPAQQQVDEVENDLIERMLQGRFAN